MSQFAAELRRGITEAQEASAAAVQAGHPYEAYLHRARLADLLEVATRHAVDTEGLVEPSMRQALDDDHAAMQGRA